MDDEINLDEELSKQFDELTKTEEADEQIKHEPETEADSGAEPETEGGEAEPEPAEEDPEESPQEGQEDDLEPNYQIPPTTWDGESKKQYKDLPAWAKRQVHKREQDTLNGIRSLKEQASRFDGVLGEHKAFLESGNINPEQALNDAIGLAKSLKQGTPQQRGQILRNIANQYGADLEVFKQEVPKEAQFLQQYLAPLQNQIGQLQQSLSSQQRPGQNEGQQVIAEFRAETDEGGKPKYPFFDVVEEGMVQAIPYIRQQNPGANQKQLLEKAYEQAVWANPDTREFMRSEQAKQEQAQRQAQAESKKATLEKANKVNLNKRGGHDGPAPTGSIDDTLSAEFDRLVPNFR